MAAHRMPDQDRPRRPVPAWVTAPPEDAAPAGLEERPAAAASAPVADGVAPVPALPEVQPAPTVVEDEIVVPDFPPDEHLLPPAPTSPTVHTVPLDDAVVAPASTRAATGLAPVGPAPVSPVDLAPPAPAPATPVVPAVGQPRFSVPGLEHVVVEGTEPEPSGPIGYRTPARFARQQAPLRPVPAAPAPLPPTRSFDAVIAPPTPDPTATAATAGPEETAGPAPRLQGERTDAQADATDPAATPARTRRPAVGVTPAAVLGAVAGLGTTGLAAWWFTAPATVHAVGVALGVLALVLSISTLRNRAATWQRPVALLGAVLGGVGTLVLLWAVAAALLPLAGVTLPDVTGTGVMPTVAP